MKMKQKAVFLALPAILFLMLPSCGILPVEEEPLSPPLVKTGKETEYSFVSVEKGDLEQYYDITATFVPLNEVNLSFEVESIPYNTAYVQVGDTVRKGDLLVELERTATLQKIEDNEYSLNLLDMQIRHQEETYALAKKYSAADDAAYERTRNDMLAQRRILETEQESLLRQNEQRAVYAPIDGTVTFIKEYEIGELSKKDFIVATVTDKSKSVFVYTGDKCTEYQVGDEVILKLNATEDSDALVVDPVEIGIEFPKKNSAYFVLTDPAMAAREYVMASIRTVTDERQDALYLPARYVNTVGEESFVYILEDNVRVVRPVEIGLLSTDGKLEIKNGLDEGDLVLAG